MTLYRRPLFLLCLTTVITVPACIGPPLELLPAELPDGIAGVAYDEELSTDSDGAETWALTDGTLPAGLVVGAASGRISGTPTETGTFDFVVEAQTASPRRTGSQSYALTIHPKLEVDATMLPARVGAAYEHTFPVTGGTPPYTFALIGLPAGLAFNRQTGTVTGTPLQPYVSLTLQLTVTDSGSLQQTATATTALAIKAETVEISTDSLPSGTVGVPYSVQVEAANGQPPYSWAVQSGLLPAGLRLSLSTGIIYGTPTSAGTATFVIRVTDSDEPADTATREFTIEIEN